MGAGRSMSSNARSSYGQLGYKPTDRSLPVPAPRQQIGSPKKDSGASIAKYGPEQRSSQEQEDAVKQAKENEQSAQWSRATSEMKTPNVMYDDRNQTEIAGKYARDTERAAPDSSYSRSRAGRDLRM